MSKNPNRFYVYEHWRPDSDLCFWVGKGTGDRARRFKRNDSYNQVSELLASLGMCVEVRMVASSLTEIDALRIECDRIEFWKCAGVELTNRSRGGSGNRAISVSLNTRLKLRTANLGRKHSAETRAKMSAARIGKPGGRASGFTHLPATIAKIRESQVGRLISAEAKAKLRSANLGKHHSIETKKKMSASRMGNTNGKGCRGIVRSEATRRRMSVAQKLRYERERAE